MVGEYKAVAADNAGGASRQPDRGEPDMIEPGRVRSKAVGLPDFLGRKIVEGPEPLFRAQHRIAEAKPKKGGCER